MIDGQTTIFGALKNGSTTALRRYRPPGSQPPVGRPPIAITIACSSAATTAILLSRWRGGVSSGAARRRRRLRFVLHTFLVRFPLETAKILLASPRRARIVQASYRAKLGEPHDIRPVRWARCSSVGRRTDWTGNCGFTQTTQVVFTFFANRWRCMNEIHDIIFVGKQGVVYPLYVYCVNVRFQGV